MLSALPLQAQIIYGRCAAALTAACNDIREIQEMVILKLGTTILTGATAKKFIYEIFCPNEEAQERFNAFLQRFPVEELNYFKDGFSASIPGLTAPKWPEHNKDGVNIS